MKSLLQNRFQEARNLLRLKVLSFEDQAKFLSFEKSVLLVLRIVGISLPFESEILRNNGESR